MQFTRHKLRNSYPPFAIFYLFSDINTVALSSRPDTEYLAHTTRNSSSVDNFVLKQFIKNTNQNFTPVYTPQKVQLMDLVVFCYCLQFQ